MLLKEGCLLNVSSHILYAPLSCQIPLPGFEGYRLCVSQYNVKERQLLRNLCYVLGVKFIEKLTKKVTHLLCKFADGDKYEAACRWGIHTVTAEWIYECCVQVIAESLIFLSPVCMLEFSFSSKFSCFDTETEQSCWFEKILP